MIISPLLKAEKLALYGAIALSLLSLVAVLEGLRGGEVEGASILPIIYLIVFGLLFGFKESKSLN